MFGVDEALILNTSDKNVDWSKFAKLLSIVQHVNVVASDATVTLTWNAVPNAHHYLVCKSTSSLQPSGGCGGERGDETTDLSRVYSNLENGVSYYFQVIAVYENGTYCDNCIHFFLQ